MEKLTFELPTLYGDHHVLEVRRIVLSLPGVTDVYASSAFHILEVTFDPGKLTAEAIRAALDQAGYLDEITIAYEEVAAAGRKSNGHRNDFRHSVAYPQTGKAIAFARQTANAGRALWPCPGMGPIKSDLEGD